jgi:hypothetical protein
MTEPEDRERFRRLPEPVRAADAVETVDTASRHPSEESEERVLRMLREAGGG